MATPAISTTGVRRLGNRWGKAPTRSPGAEYRPTQTGVARIEFDREIATVHNVRMGDYPVAGEREIRWGPVTVDLAEITNVHFMLHSWGASVRGLAHSMVCFEFAGSPNLVCSVEARLRRGQRYNVAEGFRRRFELCYNWCTEFDALLERANPTSGSSAHIASMEAHITQHRAKQLFRAAAERTNQLADEPEWYHAMNNSCSANIVGWVDEVMPGQIAHNPRWLMPGYLPEYLVKKGLVRTDAQHAGTDLLISTDALPRAVELMDEVDFEAQLRERADDNTPAAMHEIAPSTRSLDDLNIPEGARQQLTELVDTVTNRGRGLALLSGPTSAPKTAIATAVASELTTSATQWRSPLLCNGGPQERANAVMTGIAHALASSAGGDVVYIADFDALIDRSPHAVAAAIDELAGSERVVLGSVLSHQRIDHSTLDRFDHVIDLTTHST